MDPFPTNDVFLLSAVLLNPQSVNCSLSPRRFVGDKLGDSEEQLQAETAAAAAAEKR